MKTLLPLTVVLYHFAATATFAQAIEVTNFNGGSVLTDLGYNNKINLGSSLQRTWWVLNDPSCPVQISEAGIETKYENKGYIYKRVGSVAIAEAIRAVEVRHVLFDIFGRRLHTLSSTEINDYDAASPHSLGLRGSWTVFETDVSHLLTVVTFVAHVRTAKGKVWRFNERATAGELERIQLKVNPGELEAPRQKDEKGRDNPGQGRSSSRA